jgi:hypothetical protein
MSRAASFARGSDPTRTCGRAASLCVPRATAGPRPSQPWSVRAPRESRPQRSAAFRLNSRRRPLANGRGVARHDNRGPPTSRPAADEPARGETCAGPRLTTRPAADEPARSRAAPSLKRPEAAGPGWAGCARAGRAGDPALDGGWRKGGTRMAQPRQPGRPPPGCAGRFESGCRADSDRGRLAPRPVPKAYRKCCVKCKMK